MFALTRDDTSARMEQMVTVTEKLLRNKGRPVVISDFSPPRGADLSTVEQAKEIGADFVCVAYSPGKSVRVDSVAMAHVLSLKGEQDVIFNLSVRDMNKLAIQGHLLGAHLLGLENVIVLQGDGMTDRDLPQFKNVSDYRPTQLIKDITRLNQGLDFRGLKLRTATNFCIGAVIDFNKELQTEASRARAKVESGADFFLAQAFYQIEEANQFKAAYRQLTGHDFPRPIFYGVPILREDGITFGNIPTKVRRDLEQGRSGIDIALEQLQNFIQNDMTTIYLVPPILRGGRRDYAAAKEVMREFRNK